jgi:hypothetical protein
VTDLIPQCPGQLDIFGPTHPDPPHNGTETSREAAEAKKPTAAQQREAVYRFICDNWPCTLEAIEEGMGLEGNSVRPRRWELEHAGRIVAHGHALTRKGRRAVTWAPSSVFDASGQVV